MAEWLAL